MKTKTGLMVIGLILSLNSFMAHAEVKPLLELQKHSGSVAPQFAWSSNCAIYSDKVISIMKGSYSNATPRETNVAWTQKFKNAQDILEFVVKANTGTRNSIPRLWADLQKTTLATFKVVKN